MCQKIAISLSPEKRYDTFERTIQKLAQIYVKPSIMLWDHQEQQGILLSTDGNGKQMMIEEYVKSNLENSIDDAWSEYLKNELGLTIDDIMYSVTGRTDLTSFGGGRCAFYIAKYFGKQLLNE